MSMITATTWVRRGVAARFPTKYAVDEAEMNRISELAKLQLEDAQEDLKNAQDGISSPAESDSELEAGVRGNGVKLPAETEADDDLKEYDLDHYDDDPVDEEGEKFSMFGNVKSLAYHAPNEEDPYLVLPATEEDDEEREELQILASDNLLLAAKVEDEVAHLEVYVYEDEADNLYVHHDIMLPAIPLCVEWIDVPVGEGAEGRSQGNFVAVGTMDPSIEVWDLDVVDSMYPNAILGQGPEEANEAEKSGHGKGKRKKKKKKPKRPKVNDEYHIDAVLALAANRQHRNLLASGSADETVKLWDLNTAQSAKSYAMHKGKVCSLDWHPVESTVLLSGSYDQTAIASDMRSPGAKSPQWGVRSDVESVRWNVHDSNYFYAATEAGVVYYYDARVSGAHAKPVWTLQAHDAAVSAFDVNPIVPDLLVTGSDDKQVKLWNVQDNTPGLIVSRNLEVGRVFSSRFAPDETVCFRLAVAGSTGSMQVWDTSTNAAVRGAFTNRVPASAGQGKERLVRVDEDGSESEDSGEEDGGAGGGSHHGAADGWESMDED